MKINKNNLISSPKPPNKPFSSRQRSNKPLSSSNPSVTRVFKPEYSQFPPIYGNKSPFPRLRAGFELDPSPLPSPSPPPLRPRHFRVRERAWPGSQWEAAEKGQWPIARKGGGKKAEMGRGSAAGPAPYRPALGEGGNCVRGGGRRVFPWSQIPVDLRVFP